MSGLPPRRQRSYSPFPPADDLPAEEEEAFHLTAEYVPTLSDISGQVGAIGAHLNAVHSEVALIRNDLSALSQFVMSDQAPRITAVERKPLSIPPGAKTAGKYAALLGAVPVLLQILATLKPNVAGPIQTLIQLFQ